MSIRRKLYLLSGVLFFIFDGNSYLFSQNLISNDRKIDSLQLHYPIFRYYNIDYKNRKVEYKHLYSTQTQLPFFCRIENLLELNARLPIKIRLGDLNYVNSLENK